MWVSDTQGFILNRGEISRDTICEPRFFSRLAAQQQYSTSTSSSGHIRGNGDGLLQKGPFYRSSSCSWRMSRTSFNAKILFKLPRCVHTIFIMTKVLMNPIAPRTPGFYRSTADPYSTCRADSRSKLQDAAIWDDRAYASWENATRMFNGARPTKLVSASRAGSHVHGRSIPSL